MNISAPDQKILVLGGSGFIGQQLCEHLARAGHRITVPTRRAANARAVQHLPLLTVLEANVHDASQLAQLVAGHDCVVNLVAILQGKPAAFDAVHVALPKAIATACKTAGVDRLVHVSALGVSGTAPSNYLKSKWAGEQVYQASGLANLAIVRPSVVFGTGDSFTNLFAKLLAVAPVLPLAGAGAQFQPVWVDDLAKLLAILATCLRIHSLPCYKNNSAIVEAAGPEVVSFKQWVAQIGQLTGNPRPIINLPKPLATAQAMLMELAPGVPLMSRDNLASLTVPNIATGQHGQLRDFGITPSSLAAIGPSYLKLAGPHSALEGLRKLNRS